MDIAPPSSASAGSATAPPVSASSKKELAFKYKVAIVYGVILACILVFFSFIQLNSSFIGEWWSFIVYGGGTAEAWKVGLVATLYISLTSITLAIILAFLGALGRLSKNPLAYGVATFYVSLIRGTPLLIQIFILFFGLPQINQQLSRIIPDFEQRFPLVSSLLLLPALPTGILALGINYGAYMTEVFRAGIQSVGRGQTEAATALGMTPAQTLWRIVLPQAVRVVIPPIGNDFIAMTKDSALVSVIGVQELLWRSQKVGVQNFRSMETLLVAAVFYWVLTIVLQTVQSRIEKRLARSDR